MNEEEVFAVWAPQNSIWSPWVAPVLFAQTDWSDRIKAELIPPPQVPWMQGLVRDTAVVIDLPSAQSVDAGFALSGLGFRPIPLFNASPAPEKMVGLGSVSPSVSNAAIDMTPIVDAISRVTASLQRVEFPEDATPAFLLDSNRLEGTTLSASELFDNRWMVFPQDFPSAGFLLEHGIRNALLLQQDCLEAHEDLAHCLLRWQEGGVRVLAKKLDDDSPPTEITVKRPSKYKAVWYRALAQLGLRRSSAGGFGSYLPGASGGG